MPSRHHSPSAWLPPPARLSLPPPNTIHLWRINLCNPHLLSISPHNLTPSELSRAQTISKSSVRQTFVHSRSCLRDILSRYLQHTSPKLIPLAKSKFGKPELRGQNNSIHFNVSHTENLALIAVAAHVEVGVDIERKDRHITNPKQILKRVFTEREIEQIEQGGLIRGWTRKEAVLKCIGVGIAGGMKQVEIVRGRVVGRGWCVRDLEIGRGVVGAVCYGGGGDVKLVEMEWGLKEPA